MLKLRGYLGTRAWLRAHEELVKRLKKIDALSMQGNTRLWEYPWAYTQLQERECQSVLDIGTGTGAFATFLHSEGYKVIGIDNYQFLWSTTPHAAPPGVDLRAGDALNLPFDDGVFDATILISVIEHIPSNTIFCERRQCNKTEEMLREEIPIKRRAIQEALRVVRPGGVVVVTSDIYLDHAPEVNISWQELFGLKGMDRSDLWPYNGTSEALWRLYFVDFPIHKGRLLPIGITIDKRGSQENAHSVSLSA